MNPKPKIIIYHNSSCSKSRQTLALLIEHGINPVVIEYLKSPPDVKTLRALLKALGISAHQLMRKTEKIYRELKLDNPDLDELMQIQSMSENPILT